MKRFLSLIIFFLTVIPAQCAFWDAPEIKEQPGYIGTLPDIEKAFQYKQKSSRTESFVKYDAGFIMPEELTEAPIGDSLFTDMILKRDRDSNFVKDVFTVIPALEDLRKVLESDGNLQKFNANVNIVDLYVRNIENTYWDKPERFYIAYKRLIYINNRAKTVANFLYEANLYSRYLAYQTDGSQYSRENVLAQKRYLLDEIYQTIAILSRTK